LIKTEIIGMVKWAQEQTPRNHQVLIGPSEVGDLCDRRIGYRLAGVPACNTDFDTWPSIVGTAIHSWLDTAVNQWMNAHGAGHWSTETTLVINDFVEGHADLYSHQHQAVIDYKTVGPDVMKKIRRDGPPPGYQIQTHVYGYGFEQAGHPVKKVCLVFLPRAGWLRDMYVWCDDYLPDVAIGSIIRLRQIATKLIDLDILTDGNEYRWEQIDAFPSNNCGFCRWYDPSRDLERGADATGCPGR
jgi:hypothetical protein